MKFYDTLKLISRLETIQGTNAKKAFLEQNKSNKDFCDALKFLFDGNVITGIRTKKWDKIDYALVDKNPIKNIYEFFSENHTGKDEDVAKVRKFFSVNAGDSPYDCDGDQVYWNWVRAFQYDFQKRIHKCF